MTPSLRVAIPARLSSGDDGDERVLGANRLLHDIAALVQRTGLAPVVVNETVDLGDFAGLVLPGGGDIDPSIYGGAQSEAVYDVNPEQDALDLSLARAALLTGLPTLGICRGAQVLNVAAGGTLIADLPPSAVEHLHRPNPGEALDFLWHSVTMAPSRLREHLGVDGITVASGHHQGIDRLGTGLFTSAVAADGLVEAFEDEPGLVLGVQWHPEASGTPAAERDAPFLVFAETVREHSGRCAHV